MTSDYKNEQLYVMNSSVPSVIADIVDSGVNDEAFFVCDVDDIVTKYKNWRMLMPRVEPHYAVKCNNSALMLEVLSALGCGFDCSSKGEIEKVVRLGIDSSKIIFANPCKTIKHIKYAERAGVSLMTFDNETELRKIKTHFPSAKLVLRIQCDSDSARFILSAKFGCDPVVDAPVLLRIARSLDLDVVGISFHVGSGCQDPPVFRRGISAARTLFDFAASLGYKLNIVDIGGGFPGNKGTSLDEIADVVNRAIDVFFPDPQVRIIAEPGRYMAASAFTLAANIHSKRTVTKDEGVHYMYYIDDGVFGSFNLSLFDHMAVTPIAVGQKAPSGKLESSSIWGPTCDSLDQVNEDVPLPELTVGDWIMFEDMGAYTISLASGFSDFPFTKIHAIVNESTCMWNNPWMKGAIVAATSSRAITAPQTTLQLPDENHNFTPTWSPIGL